MGVRQWWSDLNTPKDIQRDGIQPYSLDAWASMFNYNGLMYGGNVPFQTLTGNKEEVANNFEGYVRQAYQSNGVTFACMLVRQMVLSDIRFVFREQKSGGPGKLISPTDGRTTGSGDLKLLTTPWPGATTGDLITRMEQSASLAGTAFVLRRNGQLRVLRPDWVTIVAGGKSKDSTIWDLDSAIIGYIYQPGGREMNRPKEALLAEEVAMYAPYPDPRSPFRGMSWMMPVLREIMADTAATTHKQNFFSNGATVNLALKFDPTTTKETFEYAKSAFLEGHQGAAQAYKTLFLLGAEPVSVGSNMQQMDFKATQGAGETRIAAAAGIHPAIVGLSEGLQGSSLNAGNFGAARRLTADKTLRPLWRNVCGSLSNIITTPSGYELWYDEADVAFLREDKADIANIQQTKAAAIRHLIDGGFTAESVVDAIDADDMTRLKHTGLFSVQLQAPGSTKMPQGEVPGETPVGPNGTKPVELNPNQPTDKPPPAVVPGSTVKAPTNGKVPAARSDEVDRMWQAVEIALMTKNADVHVDAPITVNVPEQPVTVSSPDVHVDAHVAAAPVPAVSIAMPPRKALKAKVRRDAQGHIDSVDYEDEDGEGKRTAKINRDADGTIEGVDYDDSE